MLIAHLNLKDFVYSSHQKGFYSEFGSRKVKFLKAQSLVPFLQYGRILPNCVLHIMNFSAPIVHCIRLETWFYVNSTFEYDRFCVL